jgi:hypothetical protein
VNVLRLLLRQHVEEQRVLLSGELPQRWTDGDDAAGTTRYINLAEGSVAGWKAPIRSTISPVRSVALGASPEGIWVISGEGPDGDTTLAVDRWTGTESADHAIVAGPAGVKRVSMALARDTGGRLHAFWIEYGANLLRTVKHAMATLCAPAPETCNGVDDTCEGVIDEGCSSGSGGAGGGGAGGASTGAGSPTSGSVGSGAGGSAMTGDDGAAETDSGCDCRAAGRASSGNRAAGGLIALVMALGSLALRGARRPGRR